MSISKEAEDLVVETLRRERQAELNFHAGARAELEARYGQVWDTAQMSEDFIGIGFAAPFLVVTRKSDRQKGSLEFQHSPRFYFNFMEDIK